MALKDLSHTVTRPGMRPGDPDVDISVAADLVTVPGVPLREEDLNYYGREEPLDALSIFESSSFEWLRPLRRAKSEDSIRQTVYFEKIMTPLAKWIKDSGELPPTAEPSGEDVGDLIKAKARELGNVEVGFTAVDRRYIYQSKMADYDAELPHAICIAMDQDYEMTWKTPGLASEWTHDDVYERQGSLAQELVAYLNSLGYRGQVSQPSVAYGPAMPLFVQAGLGQVGANGILMTPHMGPWLRLQTVFTDAKLTYDQPVDYGIHAFCQICQVCTNRCPGRALSREKVWFRGAHKNKVAFRRCQPMVARYSSCGVCQRVCPIGAYGMKPVMDHYMETGEVLGKGTHDLEGYYLPGKGYYGPGELPTFDKETFNMPKGRTEDWLLIQFRDKLIETKADESIDRDEMWEEFREKVEESFNRSFVSEMAMDTGGELGGV